MKVVELKFLEFDSETKLFLLGGAQLQAKIVTAQNVAAFIAVFILKGSSQQLGAAAYG